MHRVRTSGGGGETITCVGSLALGAYMGKDLRGSVFTRHSHPNRLVILSSSQHLVLYTHLVARHPTAGPFIYSIPPDSVAKIS